MLCLAGVRPIADSIGRVNKLELIPLEELGRPRIDVVVSCSGVFRDLFINQMNLLDRGVRAIFCFFVLSFLFAFLVPRDRSGVRPDTNLCPGFQVLGAIVESGRAEDAHVDVSFSFEFHGVYTCNHAR